MPSLGYTPPWSKNPISFTIFKMHGEITNDALIAKLRLLKGNIQDKRVGWLAESPLFKVDDENYKMSCFTYIQFRKNANVSNLYGNDYLQTDPISCIFDFKNKLIIAATTNDNKLTQLEKQALIPIQPLTQYTKRRYGADFPFWLSYILNKKGGSIADNIYVKDFYAISSGREAINLSDSVKSSTKCTDQIETKLILGITGIAVAASFKILANGDIYSLVLYEDGRIKIRDSKELETLEDKTVYVEQVDDILGKIYAKYLASQTEWSLARVGYQKELLNSVVDEISSFTTA